MVRPAGIAVALLLLPVLARASGDPYQQCHLLCTVEAGRTETRNSQPAGLHGVWRIETIGLTPLGAYFDGRYSPMPRRGGAVGVEVLPSIAIALHRDVLLQVSFPIEWNSSWNVILPSLVPAPGRHKEIAPGRLAASLQARLPVPDDWQAVPWIGLGYALSQSIGTTDIATPVRRDPGLALDGLGIGTNDLYLMTDFISRPDPSGWEATAGVEGRLHALPHLERAYGYTAAYHAWIGRRVAPGWTAGLRASGFRTILSVVDLDESSALILGPAIRRDLGARARVTAGFASPVPGPSLNQNSLQTFEARVAIESSF